MGLFKKKKTVEVLCRCGHNRHRHFANGSEGRCRVWLSGSGNGDDKWCECRSWGPFPVTAGGEVMYPPGTPEYEAYRRGLADAVEHERGHD